MLSNVCINSYHPLSFAPILNLVEVFSHWLAFDNVTQLILSSSQPFFLKLVENNDTLKWLVGSFTKEQMKLPPVPVTTRWDS